MGVSVQAVVYEALRMRPGTTGTFPKVVPPHGETIQGKFIPGGTRIASNIPAVLRDTDVFGSDAALFRPERWLDVEGPRRTEMENHVEMVFGTGRWMCGGKPIAFMELYKTFFEVCDILDGTRPELVHLLLIDNDQLLRHFNFQIANPMKPLDSICYNVFVEQNMVRSLSRPAFLCRAI